MPTRPGDTWFLTAREKRIAHERLVAKGAAEENEKVELKHIKMALFNINNYICAVGFFLVNITVQGIALTMVSATSPSTFVFCLLTFASLLF